MSSSALSIAVSALRTQQYAIETTGQNIANAATPGYRRERVELRAAYPRDGGLGPMGAGVEASGITRATDGLSDLRVRGSSAQASYFGTRGTLMKSAEDLFGEPDNGVTTQLTSMFDAFATLATNPTDGAARTQVLSTLNGVAARVNDIRTGLDQLQNSASTQLGTTLDQANSLTARIAQINTFAKVPGGLPADLADERDRDLDQLASSIGATSELTSDGQARVLIGGIAIVDQERSVSLKVDPTTPGQVLGSTGALQLGGTAGGLQKAITSDLADTRTQLDSFVTGFVTTLNNAHATGFTPSGSPGGPLFTDSSGVLSVAVTQPDQLAVTDVAGQTQNGNVADAMAQLRTTQGATFQMVSTGLSANVASIGRSTDTAQSINDSASSQRDSNTGVNMDEEMSDLLMHQRAYESAAQLVKTVDEMLQTLVGMTA